MADEFEPWPGAVDVDTGPSLDELVPRALDLLGRGGADDEGRGDTPQGLATSATAPR
jgi:hypothetical protein